MKKRVLSLFLAIILAFAFTVPASAYTYAAEASADYLFCVDLFKGTGTDSVGDPIYELDGTLTRQQALIMLIRLLGLESEVTGNYWWHPFTDVDSWASNYVGYAYQTGITNGLSATKFGGGSTASTAAQYVTFVLRALGYIEGVYNDFVWSNPWALSDYIGLTSTYTKNISNFTRGDAAEISYNALDLSTQYGYYDTLRQSLQRLGAIPSSDIIKISADTIYIPVGYYSTLMWVYQSDEYSEVILNAEWSDSSVIDCEWDEWYNQCKTGLYISGLSTGTSTITVTYDQGGNYWASDTVTVVVY